MPARRPGRPGRVAGSTRSFRAPGVRHACDFTAQERAFLRRRLDGLERRGRHAGFRIEVAAEPGQAPRLAGLAAALAGRGLLQAVEAADGWRAVFTPAGLAGLKALFEHRPKNFTLFYPNLHHARGLAHLLAPPLSRSS